MKYIRETRFIAVSGYRSLTAGQMEFVRRVMDCENLKPEDVILQGGCTGVDSFINAWAIGHNIAVIEFKPAGRQREDFLARNRAMVDRCDRVIAFPSKKSKGTMHVIWYAKKLGKSIDIYDIDKFEKVGSGGGGS